MTKYSTDLELNQLHAEKKEFADFLQEKRDDWQAFMENSIINASVNPMVAQSWIRSRSAGVDPYHFPIVQLNEEELDALRQKNKRLLKCARPLMDELAEIGSDYICLMSLHDCDGYMLEMRKMTIGDSQWHDECFQPGIRWQESDVGTNGLGLVLIEHKPVQLIGAEHYSYDQRNLCCCAAPIMDRNDNIVAVLNVCSPEESFSKHLMTLVTLSCYAIMNQMFAEESHELDKMIQNVIEEGVIVLDRYNTIVGYNACIANIFQTDEEFLLGYHIQDLMRIPELEDRHIFENDISVTFKECSSYFNGHHIICDIVATAVRDNDHDIGTVIMVSNGRVVSNMLLSAIGSRPGITFDDINTKDELLLKIIEDMKANADSFSTMLLYAEEGINTEIFAHAIHSFSSRKNYPFITIHCSSETDELLVHELFGCENSDPGELFTGSRIGKLEICEKGTVFFEGIENLSLEIQSLLLQVLKTGRIRRMGSKVEHDIDIRVIASAHGDLTMAVWQNYFNQELYQILGRISYTIPPLRERSGDLKLIADKILRELNTVEYGNKILSESALKLLSEQTWPKNERQLKSVIASAYYNCNVDVLLPMHMKINNEYSDRNSSHAFTDNAEDQKEAEKQNILDCLKKYSFDVQQAADAMGISRATLYRRMKKFNIKAQYKKAEVYS